MNKLAKLSVLVVLAAGIVAVTATISAKKGGQGNQSHSQSSHGNQGNDGNQGNRGNKNNEGFHNDDRISDDHFSTDDKSIITNYFHDNRYNVSELPPGIAKNLARGKPLPPGIIKSKLPDNLFNSLHPGSDYDYFMVGNDVVKINKTTGIVSDIVHNIVIN